MVCRYEVLEYLRVYGRSRFKDIWRFFKAYGQEKNLGRIVEKLCERRLVRKLKKIVRNDLPPPPIPIVKYVEVKKNVQGSPIWYELTERAYDWLKKFNAKSFYELPSFKNRLRNLRREVIKIE
jgi:hypothetical protein